MPAILNNYEATFILGETATAEQAVAKAKELKAIIAKAGGEVTKEEQWGRRDLAYPIARSRSGIYVTMWFSLPAQEVQPLERILRFDESIIRSLVTKAYTTAQPGSLYPVAEEEKPAKPARSGSRADKEETGSAEEELRRHSVTSKKDKNAPIAEEIEELSEEDRLKQLDTQLDELLKDEEE